MLKIVSVALYPLTLYRVLNFISLIKCVITKKEAETQVPNFSLFLVHRYVYVVIVVFCNASTIWHWIPSVGWSVFAIKWCVETLFPDDVADPTASHILDGLICNLITEC